MPCQYCKYRLDSQKITCRYVSPRQVCFSFATRESNYTTSPGARLVFMQVRFYCLPSFGDCMQGRRQPVGTGLHFFFRPIDFSQLYFGRHLKLLGKISYGPTTSQKAGYALEYSSISAAIKLISKCIKGACNNFRSPLMKTQDRSVKMLGLELELFKLHSF